VLAVEGVKVHLHRVETSLPIVRHNLSTIKGFR